MSYPTLRSKSILLAGIVGCSLMGCKNVSDDPLAGWETMAYEPAANAIFLQQAETSRCVWRVAQDAGNQRITIQPTAPQAPKEPPIRLQTEAGLLVGTDNGEWGGSLSLVDASGVPSKLLDANVIQLVPSPSGVLVLTGLLHLGIDGGAVWLFHKSSIGSWSITKITDLDGKPRAMSTEHGDVLVVGAHGVYRLDQALSLTTISLPFQLTFTNSIAEDKSGKIYVGMNGFVVRLTPTKTGYSHEWFTKPECLPN